MSAKYDDCILSKGKMGKSVTGWLATAAPWTFDGYFNFTGMLCHHTLTNQLYDGRQDHDVSNG